MIQILLYWKKFIFSVLSLKFNESKWIIHCYIFARSSFREVKYLHNHLSFLERENVELLHFLKFPRPKYLWFK